MCYAKLRSGLLSALTFLGSLTNGVLAATAFSLEHQGSAFDVIRLDRGDEQRLRFFWKQEDDTPYSSIHRVREALASRGKDLAFAINGGIFSEQFTPLGLYIEDGRRYYQLNRGGGGGNFFLKPNGVFYITARSAAVAATEDYRPRDPVKNAVQSGPMLVIKGRLHPRFIEASPSRFVRAGVGVDRQRRTLFAISNAPVNFHDFGTLFRDALDCPNALYLDGSIAAMYAPALNRHGGWPWQRLTTIIGLESTP